jgi:hypothetical protein
MRVDEMSVEITTHQSGVYEYKSLLLSTEVDEGDSARDS